MKHKKYWILIGILLGFAVLIHLFSADSLRVEHYYSTGIYPHISIFLRSLFGWLPFSIGDLLYGLVFLWLLIKLIFFAKKMPGKQSLSKQYLPFLRRVPAIFLLVYILFNTLWGINYNRKGIASQLALPMSGYSVVELKALNALLLQKVNASNSALLQNPPVKMSSKEIFSRSQDAYELANKRYPFLNYQAPSMKTSIWGWLGNYLGFLGYYNPFTGEGQVNTTVPKFLQPYINCHEIAHQLGYAKENEANFVGYLAAVSSNDETFHYSVYLDLFLYANNNLSQTDSLTANSFKKKLLPAVKADLNEWREFITRHKNPVEPVFRWIYGKYLEGNQQPTGMLSYDEVTGFMIAYYRKNREL